MANIRETIVTRHDREITKEIMVEWLEHRDEHRVPTVGSKCRVSITNISFFDVNGPCEVDEYSRYFKPGFNGHIELGSADCFIDMDLDLCLESTAEGEICQLNMHYFDKDRITRKLVTCRLEVLHVQERDLPCDWSLQELYVSASAHKERGVQLVREGRPADAFRRFGKALTMLIAMEPVSRHDISLERYEELRNLAVHLYNNLAHCQLHYCQHKAAEKLANKALALDSDNCKALYRRALARAGLQQWEAAHSDMHRVVYMNPHDKLAQQKLKLFKQNVDNINQEYKTLCQKMFDSL